MGLLIECSVPWEGGTHFGSTRFAALNDLFDFDRSDFACAVRPQTVQ